jgi:hypothetical protein
MILAQHWFVTWVYLNDVHSFFAILSLYLAKSGEGLQGASPAIHCCHILRLPVILELLANSV